MSWKGLGGEETGRERETGTDNGAKEDEEEKSVIDDNV